MRPSASGARLRTLLGTSLLSVALFAGLAAPAAALTPEQDALAAASAAPAAGSAPPDESGPAQGGSDLLGDLAAGLTQGLGLDDVVSPLGSTAIPAGSDRRLTILLLGSDYRPRYPGDRTDVMMVVSVNVSPNSSSYRRISAVSIPRDIKYFPRAGGGSHTYAHSAYVNYKTSSCNAQCAAGKFKRDVAYTLGIPIDYYAYIRFTGFNALIDKIGRVNVYLNPTTYPYGIRDSLYWHNPRKRGVMFPKGWNNSLDGHTVCGGLSIACKNALVFVRSRGGPNNSDYARARRQQDVILATIKKVTANGSGALPALLTVAAASATTTGIMSDMPRTLGHAQWLFGVLDGATMPTSSRAILGPSKYASRIGTTYQYRLNLSAVRSLCDKLFAAV